MTAISIPFVKPYLSFDVDGVIVYFLFYGAFASSMLFVGWDAWRRGRSIWLALMMCLLAVWPLSILWWLWLRPETIKKKNMRR
jgi:hypothetical protein